MVYVKKQACRNAVNMKKQASRNAVNMKKQACRNAVNMKKQACRNVTYMKEQACRNATYGGIPFNLLNPRIFPDRSGKITGIRLVDCQNLRNFFALHIENCKIYGDIGD